ncbi:hypothetical protein [Streptomyces sp. NPDC001274]
MDLGPDSAAMARIWGHGIEGASCPSP